MEILGTKLIARAAKASRTFLALHERQVRTRSGKEFDYFFVTRGEEALAPSEKKPDAVIVVAIVPGDPPRLVLTSEFRIPLGCREISFPAGLIDAEDYKDGGTIRGAAMQAAVREMREETGLDFSPTAVSPNNLYSSAGMTNESCIIVFGFAEGTPNDDALEAGEDIETLLVAFPEMVEMLDTRSDLVYSKVAWPFLWAFKFAGGFTLGFPRDCHHEGGRNANQGCSTSDNRSECPYHE